MLALGCRCKQLGGFEIDNERVTLEDVSFFTDGGRRGVGRRREEDGGREREEERGGEGERKRRGGEGRRKRKRVGKRGEESGERGKEEGKRVEKTGIEW